MKTKKKVVSKPRKIRAKKIVKKSSTNLLAKAIVIIAAVTVGVVAWYFFPRGKKVDINYIGNESGVVDLSLTPATLELTPNQESTITMNISTGSTKISVAQIELSYDSSKIGTPTVVLGDFLPNELTSVKTDNDKITFIVGATMTSGGSEGSGVLATITIKPALDGVSSISFTENTKAYFSGSTNVIKSATGTAISVTTAVETSASPSTVASPSPSPSPSPSAPVAPAKPAKPTGLRSNCFDGGNKITLRWDAVSDASSYKLRIDQKDDSETYRYFDGIKNTDYETTITPDKKYSWWVHTTRDGVDSEEAKIDEVICAKTITASTPTPTATPKPTVKPTIKPTVKPAAAPVVASVKPTTKPSPSARASTAPVVVIPAIPYSCPELCGDNKCNVGCGESYQNCKTDCTINDTTVEKTAETSVSFWQKIIDWIKSIVVPTSN